MRSDVLELLREAGGCISGEKIAEQLGVTRAAVWKKIAALREAGYDIASAPRSGYVLRSAPDRLIEAEIAKDLGTVLVGKKIICYDAVDSTNLVLKQLAHEGAEDGTVVVADRQGTGRGRMERPFFSPPGKGIWVSILLRPTFLPQDAPKCTLMAAVAVARAMEHFGLRAAIKWPNDILHEGRKLVGILTEMSAEMDRVNYVVIGIGINVNTDSFPEEIREVATSLAIEQGKETARTPIIAAVWKQFARYEKLFEEKGSFTALKERYEALLANRGREVRVLDPDGEYCGVAEGITEGGELLVRREDQSLTAVRSGEVSVRGIYGYI